jgi:hypothetical protein
MCHQTCVTIRCLVISVLGTCECHACHKLCVPTYQTAIFVGTEHVLVRKRTLYQRVCGTQGGPTALASVTWPVSQAGKLPCEACTQLTAAVGNALKNQVDSAVVTLLGNN